MSSVDDLSQSILSSFLSTAFTELSFYPYDPSLFPWSSLDAFITDWLNAFLWGNSAPLIESVAVCGHSQRVIERCVQAFEKLAGSSAYPSSVMEEIRHMKGVLESESAASGGMFVEDVKMIDVEDGQSSCFSPKESHPSASLPKPVVDEMINELREESTTVIMSFSTEQRPGACEDLIDAFDTNDLDDIPCGSQVTIGKKSVCDHYPPAYLIRVSRKGVRGHPKKEYFRCQHIRALKKSIRQLKDNKFPKASIHKVNANNPTQKHIWEEMKRIFEVHRKELLRVSCTEEGPLTDGKKKRKDSPRTADSRSFNNGFCASFFASEPVRMFNTLFSDLVYAVSADEMCKKMKARCCESSIHSSLCEIIWERVHIYAREDMIRELKLDVLVPDSDLKPEDFLR